MPDAPGSVQDATDGLSIDPSRARECNVGTPPLCTSGLEDSESVCVPQSAGAPACPAPLRLNKRAEATLH